MLVKTQNEDDVWSGLVSVLFGFEFYGLAVYRFGFKFHGLAVLVYVVWLKGSNVWVWVSYPIWSKKMDYNAFSNICDGKKSNGGLVRNFSLTVWWHQCFSKGLKAHLKNNWKFLIRVSNVNGLCAFISYDQLSLETMGIKKDVYWVCIKKKPHITFLELEQLK